MAAITVCAECGGEARVQSANRVKDVNFCSRGCSTRFSVKHPTGPMRQKQLRQRTGVERPCANCGTIIYLSNARLRRGSANNYCSKSCNTIHKRTGKFGPNASNWKGGISKYPWAFRIARPQVLERDTFACTGTGPHKGRLEVHHKDNDKYNTELENLITVCVGCHKRMHKWCN